MAALFCLQAGRAARRNRAALGGSPLGRRHQEVRPEFKPPDLFGYEHRSRRRWLVLDARLRRSSVSWPCTATPFWALSVRGTKRLVLAAAPTNRPWRFRPPAGTVRVSFQHRYGKLPLDREAGLRAAVNDDFETLLQALGVAEVKKEVAEDPTRLEHMVLALAKDARCRELRGDVRGRANRLAPTKVFTESSWQLTPETRAALATAGIKQVVAMAASKPNAARVGE